MDFVRLIRSIDELIYEICLWVLQVPKTFLKIMRPGWTITYTSQELKKQEKERFQEYVSPMLLWLIVVVIPTFILLKSFLAGLSPGNESFKEILGESLETRILVVSTFLVAGPLTFAVAIHLSQRKTITKEDFKENFFIQIYAFTPLEFFLLWILPAADTQDGSIAQAISMFMLPLGALYSWWFIYYEMRIIKSLLNTGWLKSFLWLSFLAIFANALIVAIMAMLMSLYLPDIG